MHIFRLLLAADKKESMDEWMEAMNESIIDATTWTPTVMYPTIGWS